MNLYVVAIALRNYNDHVLLIVNTRAMNEDEARGRAMMEAKRQYPNATITSMCLVHVTQELLDWAQGHKP